MGEAGKVVVWVFPGSWGLPSGSPFCVKLLNWLRMAELPHETKILEGRPKSKSGKLPYIERDDGSVLSDSQIIIDTLTKEREVKLDAHLTAQQQALALVLQRTLEDHLYWTILYERWAIDANWAQTGPSYFRGLPPVVRSIAPPLIRRSVIRDLHGQGLSRHDYGEIARQAGDDLAALSQLLGEGPWMFGDRPTSLDGLVHAFVGGILAPPFETKSKDELRKHDNLVAFVDRFWTEVWGDDRPA